MRGLAAAVVLLRLATPLSVCFCLTDRALIGVAGGAPTKIDSRQPRDAVRDIVGLVGANTPAGLILPRSVLLEDGRAVPLVTSGPATAITTADPAVVAFGAVDGRRPRGRLSPPRPRLEPERPRRETPLRPVGGGRRRLADPRTRTDGSIEPELTRPSASLAATCSVVTTHLVRNAELHRQTWLIALPPPHQFGRVALLTRDLSLDGPLRPASKMIAAGLIVPFAATLDAARWLSGTGREIEFPLRHHDRWLTPDAATP